MNNGVEGFSAIELCQQLDNLSESSGRSLPRGSTPRHLILMTALAIVTGVSGLCYLEIHAQTPGKSANAISIWPKDSRISRSLTQPTLVVFFHPHCPCNRAALTELQRLMLRTQSEMQVVTVLVTPQKMPANWSSGAFSLALSAIPGLNQIVDSNANEAELFGIRTSGHAKLFYPDGRLIFSGGLTTSRGHEGDSIGCAAVDRLVNDRRFALSQRTPLETSVFGCPVAAENPRAKNMRPL